MRRKRTIKRRSGFEDDFENDLILRNINYGYETETLSYSYLVPAVMKNERYTPDFPIITRTGKKIYIETKGRLTSENRKKYMRVKNLLNIDLRFVFQKANNKIYKGSSTTYSEWCDKNGFLWAERKIPDEWLME